MGLIRQSIPIKICLSILVIETILLVVLGLYYTNKFNSEIDLTLQHKLELPAVLMSERALNYDAVRSYEVMSELIREDVLKAFVFDREGKVFYSEDRRIEGDNFKAHLDGLEKDGFAEELMSSKILNFVSEKGISAFSIIAPIKLNDRLLGGLYIRIDGDRVTEKKSEVARFYFIGALVTILLTTLFEALFVYRLVVPRIEKTSRVLSDIEEYKFSTRIKDYGPPDRLGMLMQQVDSMISQIEKYMEDFVAAERKYKALFLSAREGIFRVSMEGRLLDGNPALAELLGFTSLEEIFQKRETNFFRYVCDTSDLKSIREQVAQNGFIHNVETRLRRNDGRILTVSLSVNSSFEAGDDELVYEGRFIDLTEERKKQHIEQERQAAEAVAEAKTEMIASLEMKNTQLEQALEDLKSTQQQLVQAEKMAVLGMTAGGVAHDLNNILSGIINYPEMMLKEVPEDSPLRQPLEGIRSSGKRAAAVVADLLTLSKGASSQWKKISLNDLVNDYLGSLEFAKLINGDQDVQLVKKLADTPLYMECSPIHIQKVVMNLVTNGVEAMGKSGVLNISTFRYGGLGKPAPEIAEADGYCVLVISDNGSGIKSTDIEYIFEPFYTRKVLGHSGTGLGLTIVQNVVREHNGHIEVKTDGSGTTFTIFFPLAKINASDQVTTEAEIDFHGTGTILFVDDEPIQRDLGLRILSSLGYTVETAASGEEALKYLKENRVDLLILDMLMAPGISGLETYRKAIRLYPGQKAIIASGFAADDAVKRAFELGVGGFIPKPYSISRLGKAVYEILK